MDPGRKVTAFNVMPQQQSLGSAMSAEAPSAAPAVNTASAAAVPPRKDFIFYL